MATKVGRPSKLNPDTLDLICGVIGPGVRRKDAALSIGVSEQTYYSWLRRGNTEQARMDALGLTEPHPDEAIYVEFLDRTTTAWAEAKATAILTVRQAMNGTLPKGADWRAAAWWLERTYPTEYGLRRIVVDPNTPDAGHEATDDDTLAEAIATAAEQYLADNPDKREDGR